MKKNVDLSLIRTDGGTQMRAELSKDVYLEYRDRFLAGDEFPPVDLFHDGSTYWLADGFHRFYGAREAKQKQIAATVHNGTQRDAILFAVAANQKNGLRRSNADKRNAVTTLLNDEEWVKWSDNKIAEQAGVSQPTVSSIRAELIKVISSPAAKAKNEPKVGKDGKARKPKASSPKPEEPFRKCNHQYVRGECTECGYATKCPKGGAHQFDDEACVKCGEPVYPSQSKSKGPTFNYGANVTDETPAEKPPKNGSAVPAFNDRQVDDLMGKFIRHVDDHYNAIIGLFERRFEEVGGNRKLYDKAKADAESGRRRAHSAAGEVLKSFKAWRESK